ncbi:hypothetical protein [Emticicia sp.]|uniref:hypothetical protein n=1 Tax=Emticicia sp. TaxID=1930953 RepID=UPI0037507036
MKPIFTTLLLGVLCHSVFAIVKYNEGMVLVKGVQFLQEKENPSNYYYLPQYPRLARKEDGSYEFLCMKYIGQGGAETNGGLFHALVEFTLPAQFVTDLEKDLQEKTGNAKARIAGPVPLQQTMKDGEAAPGAFKVVSSILTNTSGKDAFTKNIVTSGHAPLLPGSKAAISARLTQEGATLLFNSLQGNTSDVSVTLSGYYEAATQAYNATITAETSVIYNHYSKIQNDQEGFTKDQMRKISDNLLREQLLKIEVFDQSAALGVDSKAMQGILQMVTDKLIELMFDAQNGWSKEPSREAAVEQDQLKGRQERGWFSQTFGGAQDTPYYTDHQYVLKKREDIRVNKFYLNLSQMTSIKVPFFTSGNLSVVYDSLSSITSDNRYFKTVNLDDPDFQKRDVNFQVDGEFSESFKDIFNFVTVSFRKVYGGSQPDATKDLVFKRSDIEKGGDLQLINYPRLGSQTSDWLDYEYRVSWSLKGNNLSVKDPVGENAWKKSKSSAIALTPPFSRKVIEVDADRSLYKETKQLSATVRFLVMLAGKPQVQKTITLRANDVMSTSKVTLYYDPNQTVAYQITWYDSKGRELKKDVTEITDDYLLLIPPMAIN